MRLLRIKQVLEVVPVSKSTLWAWVLMEMFNHSSQKQTLAYLGIQEADIKDAYLKEI